MKMELLKNEDGGEIHFDDLFVPVVKIEFEGVICGVSRTPKNVERPDYFGLDLVIHPKRLVPCRFDYSQGIRAVFTDQRHAVGLQHFHLPFTTQNCESLQNAIGARVKFVGDGGILLHSPNQQNGTARALCSRDPKFLGLVRTNFPDFELEDDPRFSQLGNCHCIKKYYIERTPSAIARLSKYFGIAGYGGQIVKNSFDKMNKARDDNAAASGGKSRAARATGGGMASIAADIASPGAGVGGGGGYGSTNSSSKYTVNGFDIDKVRQQKNK